MLNYCSRAMFCLMLSSVLFFSCKKEAGEGGRATIRGKVYTVNYNSAMTVPQDSGYIGGEKVYIVYGEEQGVSDDVDTDNNGAYEFKYLRKGSYKIYVYCKVGQNKLDSAVVQTVSITDRKATINLPDFKINTDKN